MVKALQQILNSQQQLTDMTFVLFVSFSLYFYLRYFFVMLRLNDIFMQMVVRRTLQTLIRSRYPAQVLIHHLYAA